MARGDIVAEALDLIRARESFHWDCLGSHRRAERARNERIALSCGSFGIFGYPSVDIFLFRLEEATMHRLALFVFIFSCSFSSMPCYAVWTMAVAGNVAILLLAPPTGVQALNVAPSALPRRDISTFQSSTASSIPTATLSRSKLFGTPRRCASDQRIPSRSALRSSTPNGSDAVNVEVKETSSTSKSSSSFLGALDNFGMKLKPWAVSAYAKSLGSSSSTSDVNGGGTNTTTTSGSSESVGTVRSILLRIQANVLWMLYIIYRGYRGFFVILPAVFREVYRQLEESDLAFDVYGDEDEEEREYAVNANANAAEQSSQHPMRLRTRITISVLSVMLTLSYVVSGALRVLGKFIKTFTSTTSMESSFEAAAEEVVVNEDKLRNKMK